VILKNGQQISQVLLQWEGMPETEATWEDLAVIQKHYPNFNLEDKVGFNGGGIVRDSTVKGRRTEGPSSKGKGHLAKATKSWSRRRSEREKIPNSKWDDYFI